MNLLQRPKSKIIGKKFSSFVPVPFNYFFLDTLMKFKAED